MPIPLCSEQRVAPSTPPHIHSNFRQFRVLRVLFATLLALASLFAVVYATVFLLAHGLTNGPATLPAYPDVGYSAGAAGTAQAGSGWRVQQCASGSQTVWGKSLTLPQTESVCGDVHVYGGDATLDGNVQGSVTVVGGRAIVNGAVTGDVTTLGGDVVLGAHADVGGNVDALGGTVRKAPSALVGGNIEHGFAFHGVTPLSWLGFTGAFMLRWWSLLFWGLAAALAAIFFPGQLRRVRSALRREPGMSALLGFATLVVGAIVGLVLFITCIGIPVALVLGVALWLAWILGTVALGLWIGEGLLRLGGPTDRPPVLAAVVGVLALTLCESVPCVGGVINLAAGFLGLGAAMLALLHSRQATALRARMF